MPLECFICPDEGMIPVRDCIAKCRLPYRCLTLPTLIAVSEERPWNGEPSTTQLLNGTMLEYLKLTTPYNIYPDSRAFMLAGRKHHEQMEAVAKEIGLPAELALSGDRDIFDLLEVEDGQVILTDYKNWGSFKVAKALGITETGKQPDPSGAVYKSSGKWGKEGSPKMVPTFEQVPDKAENWEAELQLNRYRIMLEDLGVKVHRLQLQVTVRDGSLFIAKQRGVERNTYRIPVPTMENETVKVYFADKDFLLKQAMESGWSTPCSPLECWDGIRCERYCDVAEFCPKGILVKSLEGGK